MANTCAVFAALDPCGAHPSIQCAALAARPSDFSDKTIYLLRSWADGSGFELLMGAIECVLVANFPKVRVIQRVKPSAYSLDDPALWDEMVSKADAFVYAGAQSCSTTHYAIHYSSELERRGLPGLVLSYETLAEDAEQSIRSCGVAVRWLSCPYPMTKSDPQELQSLAVDALEHLRRPLDADEQNAHLIQKPAAPRIAVTDTLGNVQEFFLERGWTDGLPVIPPTERSVANMLTGTSLAADTTVVEAMEPGMRKVSVESVAVNAVMAGCTPQALPIVLAAVHAFAKGHPNGPDDFSTPARSTNSFAFMQIVNGPIRLAAGMNGGLNALGPGNRANASIGRALRLAIINLGGGKVGSNLMPVQGNPAAYTFAFAENEEASPWTSLAASQGYSADENVLTLMTGGWSHTGNYMQGSLDDLAQAAKTFEFPSGLAVLAAPGRAHALTQEGMDKETAEDRIWSLAAKPATDFRRGVYWTGLIEPTLRQPAEVRRWVWSSDLLDAEDSELVPVFPRSAVKLIIVGGDVSPMMQGWMMQSAQSVSIDEWC